MGEDLGLWSPDRAGRRMKSVADDGMNVPAGKPEDMTDTTELFDRPPTAPRGGRGGNRPPTSDPFVLAAGVLISAIVIIVVVLALLGDNDSSVDTTDTSTTTATTTESTSTETTASTSTDSVTSSSASTTESSTTSSATTTSTAPTTTTVLDPDTYRSAAWPWVDSATRFTDPVEAARSFAVDFIGFTDPIVGDFQQGDSRSGEVEIRPEASGPVTVVFVRQLGSDDTWWILGSATENITLTEPTAMSEVESPLTVAGTVLAFEGHVDIALRADGVTLPLVETFATGGGDVPRPFETTVEWSGTDSGGGALVLTTASAEDGRIWEAAVTRLLFNGT